MSSRFHFLSTFYTTINDNYHCAKLHIYSLLAPAHKPAAFRVQNSPAAGVHPLNHHMLQHHLALGALDDVFLHGVLDDQPVDTDLLLLPDAVRPGLRLRGEDIVG